MTRRQAAPAGAYRKYVLLVTLCVAGVVLFHFLIWEVITKDLLTMEAGSYVGDLSRIGYVYTDKKRQMLVSLPRRHLKAHEYRGGPIDVVTMGDSFALGGGGGENPYFQDWIASQHDLDVLHLRNYFQDKETFRSAIVLANSGYFQKLHAKYMLLECVERTCLREWGGDFDFAEKDSLQKIEMYYRDITPLDFEALRISYSFINTGNPKFFLYLFLYKVNDRAFFSDVYVRNISRSVFTGVNSDKLIFYYEDLQNIPSATPEAMKRFNGNINRLADILQKQGIRLYALIIPDKYTLYSGFIINNPYPRSTFFEQLRELPKSYAFIDGKAILSEAVEKGEKDVFHPDDTHWSWKASKTISEHFRF